MPRAGDAFLTGNLQLTHDPLARIDMQKNKPIFDLEAFIDSIRAMIEDYIIPLVKDLTGVDLSILMSLLDPAFELLEQLARALDGIELVSGAVLGAITGGIFSLFAGLGIDLATPIEFFTSLATMIGSGDIGVMTFVNAIVSFIVQALTGSVGGLPELTSWSGGIPILTDLVEAITGIVGGGLPDLVSWASQVPLLDIITGLLSGFVIPGLDASKITSGTFAQTLVSGLTGDLGTLTDTAHGIVDGIVNGLLGLNGTLWPQAQADAALKAQADATAAAAAALAAILASQNNNNTGGVNAVFDFSTYPDSTNLPADFVQTYTGAGVTGTYGVVSGNGRVTGFEAFNNVRGFFAESNVDTLTDYQRVGAVWTAPPGISYQNPSPLFLPLPYFGPYAAETDLYCRYKDVNNWVRLTYTPSGLALQSCIAGTVTTLASTGNTLSPNTITWLEAGFGVSARTYRVIAGTQVLITYTDPGTATQVGSAFRGSAMGGTLVGAQGAGLPVSTSPILYMAVQDNSPASVVGSGARVFRASTSSVAQTSGGQLANNTLDTVEFLTDEYTYTPGTNCRITVSKTDWYAVSARLQSGNGMTRINLFKNGTVVRQGYDFGNTTSFGMAVSAVMYLVAGDYVTVGMVATIATAVGDAGGTVSYLEITRVGRVNT